MSAIATNTLTRVAFAALLATGAPLHGETPAQGGHVMVSLEDLAWAPSRTPGLSIAIAEGDPAKPGPFTMMLKLSDGAWIAPHWHNVDKRHVVISGELRMGSGDTLDAASTRRLSTGGVAVVPALSRHYEGASGETVVALLAVGPFTTTFVTPPTP